MFVAGSNDLEKDVVKMKIKNYGKGNTESKIAIKEMPFNQVMKAFSSIKMNKKVYKKSSKN